MTTYKSIKKYILNIEGKRYEIEIMAVWDKFAKVPYYIAYVDDNRTICRYSKIAKRDVINYIERYL